MTILGFLLLFLVSYVVGSVPFGLLLGFIKNVDIRKHGSHNIGATNAARSLGMKLGLLTLLLDGLKAIVIPLIFYKLPAEAKIISFLGAFVGHVFSCFLNFNGGKGVATFFFTTLLIDPRMALVFVTFWIVFVSISRYVSLGSIMAFLGSTFYWMINEQDTIHPPKYYSYVTAYCIFCSIVAIYRHKKNIIGILNKSERVLSFSKHGKK